MAKLPSISRRLWLLALLPPLLYGALLVYRATRWQMWMWLPQTLRAADTGEIDAGGEQHLIFFLVDHYEPGRGETGFARHQEWLDGFKPIAERHRDSMGERFQYTWFYPYDHRNEAVLASLSQAVYAGFGELELHWHHPTFDDQSFPAQLDSAIAWFQSYGALISSGPVPATNFGFVHGNWALDNSLPFCGVDSELEILRSRGCFADFTFSTIGTACQPKQINSIYYAPDTPGPKSYDTGIQARVGQTPPDALMIFQGPIDFDWLRLRAEYGALGDATPSAAAVGRWIDSNVHVAGRPEWVFVKIYTHGIQAQILKTGDFALLLDLVEQVAQERGLALHYVTAREAYNIAKAAEAGELGNPSDYRDFRIPKPCNRFFHADRPVRIERVTESEAVFAPLTQSR